MSTSKDSSSVTGDKDKKLNRTQLGAFGNNPSMMRLYDLIRSTYQTYKSSLNSSESDRFSQLLSTTLTCLQSILTLVPIQDILKHVEETLTYLKSTFNVDKIKTIQCTQEVNNSHSVYKPGNSPSFPATAKSPSIGQQSNRPGRKQTVEHFDSIEPCRDEPSHDHHPTADDASLRLTAYVECQH